MSRSSPKENRGGEETLRSGSAGRYPLYRMRTCGREMRGGNSLYTLHRIRASDRLRLVPTPSDKSENAAGSSTPISVAGPRGFAGRRTLGRTNSRWNLTSDVPDVRPLRDAPFRLSRVGRSAQFHKQARGAAKLGYSRTNC